MRRDSGKTKTRCSMNRAYVISLITGLLFFLTGVRLYFRGDTVGTILHILLALALFVSALKLHGSEDGGE